MDGLNAVARHARVVHHFLVQGISTVLKVKGYLKKLMASSNSYLTA